MVVDGALSGRDGRGRTGRAYAALTRGARTAGGESTADERVTFRGEEVGLAFGRVGIEVVGIETARRGGVGLVGARDVDGHVGVT